MLKDYNHFKGSGLSRAEKIQRKIVDMIIESKLPDAKRESSKAWELKHSSSCCQIGRILAEKRNLDVEMAEIICVMHDIYVIVEGTYKDHARKGAVIAGKILEESGDFTEKEIKLITDAIAQHSDKDVYTKNPYVELVKDADILDCSLYQGVEGYYKLHKPEPVLKEYLNRLVKTRKEMEMQTKRLFRD